MNELELLRKALNEAEENEMLQEEIHVTSDASSIIFNGKMAYTGKSKISLELMMKMPDVIKHYMSETTYNDLSESQFKEASNRIQKVLQEEAESFEQNLKRRLASYGLQEGENNG